MNARAMLEAETSTVVFHMDDRSTDFLKPIYEGRGYPVVTEAVSQQEAKRLIEGHARVFMLGHGGPGGLFTRGFYADDSIGPLLAAKKDGVYIWCNADAYAARNGLTGLVSGMFISEVGEARMFGITASQDEVDASNAAFAKAARQVLDSGAAYGTVRDCYKSAACAITQFNNERLYVFQNGQATPALHKTSQAHNNFHRQRRDSANHDYQSSGEHDDQSSGEQFDDLFLFDELLALAGGCVSDVLQHHTSPESAADELMRHAPDAGWSTYQLVVQILRQGLAQGEKADLPMITQQVVDAIVG